MLPTVTTVGGSFLNQAGEEKLSTNLKQGRNIVSGGGFSKVFTKGNGYDLSYQRAAVDSWLRRPEASNSIPGFLPEGDVGVGKPDVSALSANILIILGNHVNGVSGTSASSPIFAGIVNLCASQLPDDVAGFGWINPLLYKNQEIFSDIVGGNNQYNEDNTPCPDPPNANGTFYGFEATPGWVSTILLYYVSSTIQMEGVLLWARLLFD